MIKIDTQDMDWIGLFMVDALPLSPSYDCYCYSSNSDWKTRKCLYLIGKCWLEKC